MNERLKLNQEFSWSFQPEVGRLMFRELHKKGKVAETALVFFEEVDQAKSEWSLRKIALQEYDDFKFSGRILTQPFLQQCHDEYIKSDVVIVDGPIKIVYRIPQELELRIFLESIPEGMKTNGQILRASQMPPNKFLDWMNEIKASEKLMDEEKARLIKICRNLIKRDRERCYPEL
jgi:hypothetical protein